MTKTSNDPCDLDLWPFDLEMVPSTLRPQGSCVSHMKWIGEIGKEPQSGQGKNFEWPVWPWPLTFHPENGVCPLMCSMYARYEVLRSNKEESMVRPWQKLLITIVNFISNDWCDLDLWSFDVEMDCNASTHHGLHLYQVCSRSVT